MATESSSSTTGSNKPAAISTNSQNIALSQTSERVSAHTHVKGLGLTDDGLQVDDEKTCGLVGQIAARQA
jgi:DNA helicase TIP49 (TBP-interacting protein)